jgi:hypothetical protein
VAVAADWWRTASVDSGGSVWQQLQELATDAARLQGEMARGYAAAARAAVGKNGPSSGELLNSLGGQFEDYVREVGRLNLAYARGWQDLATTSSERLQDLVTGAPVPDDGHGRSRTTVRRADPNGDPDGAGSVHAASPPHASLVLDGPIGGTASGVFTVANPREDTVRLSFDPGRLSDRAELDETGSAEGFQPAFAFDPATLELAPGSESTVTITLRLPARTFTAGRDYRGEVQVIGGDGAVLDVTVRPRARAAPRKAAPKTAAPRKAAPKKAAPKKAAAKKAAAKRPARAPRIPRQQG